MPAACAPSRCQQRVAPRRALQRQASNDAIYEGANAPPCCMAPSPSGLREPLMPIRLDLPCFSLRIPLHTQLSGWEWRELAHHLAPPCRLHPTPGQVGSFSFLVLGRLSPRLTPGTVDFVDFDLRNRFVGVSTYHLQPRIGFAILIQSYKQCNAAT